MTTNEFNIKVLDCTIRDGGYITDWHFDKNLVREVYRALSKSGVEIVEIGYKGTEKYFNPNKYGLWRFTSEDDLNEVTDGIKGAKISIMGDFGKTELGDYPDKDESKVDMVRIAAHKDKIDDALLFLSEIGSKGYITSLQAMGFTGYSLKERDELKKALQASDIDYFYIADSYGSLFPHQIKPLFDPFLEIEGLKIGFHPHNSLQMAFANTLEAIKIGVDIVDGSIYGMGRGAGNLPIETLIAYMQMNSHDKYNVIPVLSVLDKYFIELQKKDPWGYQLPYMVSGIFKCHPSYAKELIERREYTIEDIWKVMEVIQEMNPIGFERSIIENLIEKGYIGSLDSKCVPDHALQPAECKSRNEVPYIDRHKGKDFLVLANGPSLEKYKDQINAFIERYDPIILAANFLNGLFVPHYHAFNNKKRFTMYIDTVDPASKLLIGENIPQEMIDEYVSIKYETLHFKDVLDSSFNIINGKIQSNCRTISVLLLGVAIVMGASRIFVAGMDGYLGKDNITNTLFYEEKIEPAKEEYLVDRHRWNDFFLNQIDKYLFDINKEGIHILTPTCHRSFYKGITNYV
jgi:4-hydroxy 2-oxovalerate aldolase